MTMENTNSFTSISSPHDSSIIFCSTKENITIRTVFQIGDSSFVSMKNKRSLLVHAIQKFTYHSLITTLYVFLINRGESAIIMKFPFSSKETYKIKRNNIINRKLEYIKEQLFILIVKDRIYYPLIQYMIYFLQFKLYQHTILH